jgi:Transposase
MRYGSVLAPPASFATGSRTLKSFLPNADMVRIRPYRILLPVSSRRASLSTWLVVAKQTELRSFALGVERDRTAIEATLRFPWSNGPVEGYIHRLKLRKRQGYGRAKLDLP